MATTLTIDKAAPTRAVKYGSMSRDRVWALRWSYFFLTLFAVFSLVPPIYMLITSLKTSAEISAATNPWWVFHPSLDYYRELLTSNVYLTFFRNSALVSVLVVIITMLISIPAAFALARMRFWGSATLATGVFLTYLIPDSLLFLPLFKMFALFGDITGIHLIGKWYVLVIVYPTLTVPFCTWIMIGYFASIPKELDEAAIIDGASWFQTLTRIFIPVALPGLIAATIFAFTVSWAQFLYPLGVHHRDRPAGIAGRHRHDAGQGRRLQLGTDHDRRPARRSTSPDHLRLPDGLLHCRPDRRRDKGLISMADVTLRKVIKRYEDVEAVRGIDLDIADHEFVVLVGPSGCGKSTTLRMIAGLEDITDGDIMIGGDVVNDVPPKDRDIAMVFQNYALYPHMTVAENMSFGLRLKHYPKAEIKTRIDEAARMLDIVELVDRKPKQLSGGQRQRVAMGRAIVRNPKVFLFDEPLSNLDAKLRVQMRIEIKKVHQKVRTTTVYVTHDQVEAMTLADRVVVMNKGRIEQIGTPNDLYHNPATRFVAGFIGSPAMNFIPCRLEEVGGKLNIRLTDRIAFPLPPARAARYQNVARDEKLLLGLRPEHIAEAKAHPEPGIEAFDAVLDVIEPMGMETLVYFTLEGTQEICGRVNPNAAAQAGSPLRLAVDLNNMHLLNEGTGAVI